MLLLLPVCSTEGNNPACLHALWDEMHAALLDWMEPHKPRHDSHSGGAATATQDGTAAAAAAAAAGSHPKGGERVTHHHRAAKRAFAAMESGAEAGALQQVSCHSMCVCACVQVVF